VRLFSITEFFVHETHCFSDGSVRIIRTEEAFMPLQELKMVAIENNFKVEEWIANKNKLIPKKHRHLEGEYIPHKRIRIIDIAPNRQTS
jgi:hypothetical protein